MGVDDFSPSVPVFTVCKDCGGYFQNVIKLDDVKREKIIFSVKGGSVTVYGHDLSVRYFIDGDLAVNGKIKGVETDDEQR